MARRNRLEHSRIHIAECHWLHVAGGLREQGIAAFVENRARPMRRLHPGGELLGRDSVNLEAHAWKAVSAEMRRQTLERALSVSFKVQPRCHPRHRVNLRSKLRDEEDIPH